MKQSLIKVKALKMGFYDSVRKYEGDIFVLQDEKHFSSRWMEKLPYGEVASVKAAAPKLVRVKNLDDDVI